MKQSLSASEVNSNLRSSFISK